MAVEAALLLDESLLLNKKRELIVSAAFNYNTVQIFGSTSFFCQSREAA